MDKISKTLMIAESALILGKLLQDKENLCQEEIDLLKVCNFYLSSMSSIEDLYLKVCKKYNKLASKDSKPLTEDGVLKNFRLVSLPEVTGTPPLPEPEVVVSDDYEDEEVFASMEDDEFFHWDEWSSSAAADDLSYSDYKNMIKAATPQTIRPTRDAEPWLGMAAGIHLGGLNPIAKVFERK